jgi:yecA family protein
MSTSNAPVPRMPTAGEVADAARRAGLATDVAELHGALCGWIAGGGAVGPDWLARVFADPALPAAEGVLKDLAEATSAQFSDREFSFELLLPPADASLQERSGALFEWCRGFLGGFGLAAGAEPPLSEESREALGDLARLAAAQPQDDGDDEDEAALSEIEEFVRVAVLLMHGDCVLGPAHRQSLH